MNNYQIDGPSQLLLSTHDLAPQRGDNELLSSLAPRIFNPSNLVTELFIVMNSGDEILLNACCQTTVPSRAGIIKKMK